MLAILFIVNLPFTSSFSFFSPLHHHESSSNRPLQMSSAETLLDQTSKNMLKYGNRVEISFELPTTNQLIALEFLKSPSRLVETLWDSGKYSAIEDGKYALQCRVITFPVFGSYFPEIEIEIQKSIGKQDFKTAGLTIYTALDKQSRADFMKSLEVSFVGSLYIVDAAEENNSNTQIKGFVEYNIQGEKPSFLKLAPAFLLQGAYKILHERVVTYTQKEVVAKFISSFQRYEGIMEEFSVAEVLLAQ